MPHKDKTYDLEATTNRLLDVLEKHNVSATFFVVGMLAKTHPKVITQIAERGHVIGIHGYRHEQLAGLSPKQLAAFAAQLTETEVRLTRLTGTKPVAFRSPFLMGPRFYSPELYKLLAEHGYHYVSNREIRYQQELFHPHRLRLSHWLNKDTYTTRALMVLLNLRLVLSENITGKHGVSKFFANCRWLLTGCVPFKRHGLLEVPVYSPLDCDLVGLPLPKEPSPEPILRYATAALLGGMQKQGPYYSLNFHDWIIGSSNRITILDNVLGQLQAIDQVSFITDPLAVKPVQTSKLIGAVA
jgi:polysaccharide deacetylase